MFVLHWLQVTQNSTKLQKNNSVVHEVCISMDIVEMYRVHQSHVHKKHNANSEAFTPGNVQKYNSNQIKYTKVIKFYIGNISKHCFDMFDTLKRICERVYRTEMLQSQKSTHVSS